MGWVGDSLRFSPSFNHILIARLVVLFPSFFFCFCLVHVDLGCPNEGGVSVDFSFLSLICDSATIFFMGCPSIEFYLNLYLVFFRAFCIYCMFCDVHSCVVASPPVFVHSSPPFGCLFTSCFLVISLVMSLSFTCSLSLLSFHFLLHLLFLDPPCLRLGSFP